MKQLLSIILIVFSLSFSSAQEAYLNIGRNFTTYDYTNLQGEQNSNIESSSGTSYEIGFSFPIAEKLSIDTGITLDQYNATGGNYVNSYSWNTNYLGLQGMAKYTILNTEKFPLAIYLNGGINLNHIISGEQKINKQSYDLSKQDEFKGLYLRPIAGLGLQYFLINNVSISLTYNISKNFRLLRNADEQLDFTNHQLQFGVLMSLN
tara:strand:+ start:1749 stop:2366 length:618 start_codon:yes stop_codon:yes gene_type:complete